MTYSEVESIVKNALLDNGIDIHHTYRDYRTAEIDALAALSYIELALSITIPNDFIVTNSPKQLIDSLVAHKLIDMVV